jgi:hypothetical protein
MVFGLFKEKLNINDHKHVINYIISEEANQQWAYHVLENDFKKEAFRGLPFAKNVLNSFVTMNLNMKVSDEILSSIADLGYRKCREWLDTYNSLNKKVSKMKFNDLVKSSGPIFYYAEIMPERYPDFAFNPNAFKGLNNTQLNIYFGKRNQDYNIVMYVQREMNCYVKNMIKRKEYQKLNRIEQDHLLDTELEKIKKMKKKQQNELIEKLEDKAEKDFEKRNKFNEVGH